MVTREAGEIVLYYESTSSFMRFTVVLIDEIEGDEVPFVAKVICEPGIIDEVMSKIVMPGSDARVVAVFEGWATLDRYMPGPWRLIHKGSQSAYKGKIKWQLYENQGVATSLYQYRGA